MSEKPKACVRVRFVSVATGKEIRVDKRTLRVVESVVKKMAKPESK